jgi:hypothetical protein
MNCSDIERSGLVLEFDVTKTLVNEIINTQQKLNNKQVLLVDYGLNQYDLGKTISQNDSKFLLNDPLQLEEVLYYDTSGNTNIFNAEFIDDITVGKYLNLSGDSYYNCVYRYEGYDFNYINYNFLNGLGIEITFKVDSNTFNNKSTIFFMGARATDKYLINEHVYLFTNESEVSLLRSDIYANIRDEEVRFTLVGEKLKINEGNIITYTSKPNIERMYLYNGNTLLDSSQFIVDYRRKQIYIPNIPVGTELNLYFYTFYDNSTVIYDIVFEDLEFFVKGDDDLNDNFVKVNILTDGSIEVNLYHDNELYSYITPAKASIGWNHLFVDLRPYTLFKTQNIDEVVNDCNFSPEGVLSVYLNGLRILRSEQIPYIKFRGLTTDFSREIGLPYNIFVGGDSYGLTHSYLFNQLDKQSNLYETIEYNGVLETSYNNPFTGGIQKIRIYNNSLSSTKVKNNYLIEANNLNIRKNRGGRIIYV